MLIRSAKPSQRAAAPFGAVARFAIIALLAIVPVTIARADTAPPSALTGLLQSFVKPAPDRIVVDDRVALAEARNFLAQQKPDLAARLALYAEATPLFEQAGLAGAIEEVLSPRVALPGGGALHIEATQAATVIDVPRCAMLQEAL